MKLSKEDLVHPQLTPKATASMLGVAAQVTHFQATAADLAANYFFTAEFAGKIDELVVTSSAVCAAGESMTIDVLKNGATILTATTAYVAAATDKVIKLLLDPNKASFVAGDVFTVTRDYTAGGGPTPLANTTVIARPTFSDM